MSRAFDDALDALASGEGSVTLPDARGDTEVDVAEVGRIGVRVREVRVHRSTERDVQHEAAALPGRLRTLPDPLHPIEVSPELGGAILRTRPEAIRDNEFFEVDVRRKHTRLRKHRVSDDGGREAVDWSLTRDQLRRLIDEVHGPEPEPEAD